MYVCLNTIFCFHCYSESSALCEQFEADCRYLDLLSSQQLPNTMLKPSVDLIPHDLKRQVNDSRTDLWVQSLIFIKYLGTVLDSNLNFSGHVDHVCKKANQRMYLIRKLKTFDVDKQILETIYRSIGKASWPLIS